MKVSILTPDSKAPNLAAMKISAYHKFLGDEVLLNFPLIKADITYASVLFDWTPDPLADVVGGPKYPEDKLPPEIEKFRPDYSLYPTMEYSLGYTYKACPRTCEHCIVPRQDLDDKHYSIWDFHDPRYFKAIQLLNNNTLADPYWRETFEEILDADLKLIEHGFDARLITPEAAHYIKRVRINNIHVAFDFPEHEVEVLEGIANLKLAGVRPDRIVCYVLVGNTSHSENMHRINTLDGLGVIPFVMRLDKFDRYQTVLASYVNTRQLFKSMSWEKWKTHKGGVIEP
jgi:hypothetical protein